MKTLRIATAQDVSHLPARGPVLLLSCMDLRLVDDVVRFMEDDGLTNRYDHVIMAGAALGALGANKQKYNHWRKTFWDHLDAAYKLHHIKDVYILEHRDCGAYRMFLKKKNGTFNDCPKQQKAEKKVHLKYADQLADEIKKWVKKKKYEKINVKSFFLLNGFARMRKRNVAHQEAISFESNKTKKEGITTVMHGSCRRRRF